MQECKNPSVGIWWFYDGQLLFADSVELKDGQTYGDCIIGPSDHADYWDKLAVYEKMHVLPPELREEYFLVPRGRVVYHKDSNRFTILHGGLKKAELNKIRKFFCLPKSQTDFDTDFHYQIMEADI